MPAYRALFSDAAWAGLLDAFHQELFRLHCLMPESSLAVHLQARASAAGAFTTTGPLLLLLLLVVGTAARAR